MNSDNKYYILTKTTPGNIYFKLSPIDNENMSRIIKLTAKTPKIRLPKSYALGVFVDASIYEMFKNGYFTFDKPEELIKAAQESQVYFGDQLDFTPRKENFEQDILQILQDGKLPKINELLADSTNKEEVIMIARDNLDSLTNGVVRIIEEKYNISLRVEEA